MLHFTALAFACLTHLPALYPAPQIPQPLKVVLKLPLFERMFAEIVQVRAAARLDGS